MHSRVPFLSTTGKSMSIKGLMLEGELRDTTSFSEVGSSDWSSLGSGSGFVLE